MFADYFIILSNTGGAKDLKAEVGTLKIQILVIKDTKKDKVMKELIKFILF